MKYSGYERKPVKLHSIIHEVLKLIKASLPSTIEIVQNISNNDALIFAEPTQMHQVVMNLCTNAFHAMETTGGTLSVTLKRTSLSLQDLQDAAQVPGDYLCLTVADTGVGMDHEILQRLFDPYFTTKDKDKGTGLGLSVTHGIVQRHGGHIAVSSRVGEGSEFKVYLPVMESTHVEKKHETDAGLRKGDERILLVDDEEMVADVERQMLERLGYHVTMKTGGAEALEAFRADPFAFDMVLTDMTMPHMTGDRLAAEMLKVRRDIPIILCTGFSEASIQEKAKSIGIKGVLMKPILFKKLSDTIAGVLDAADPARG